MPRTSQWRKFFPHNAQLENKFCPFFWALQLSWKPTQPVAVRTGGQSTLSGQLPTTWKRLGFQHLDEVVQLGQGAEMQIHIRRVDMEEYEPFV